MNRKRFWYKVARIKLIQCMSISFILVRLEVTGLNFTKHKSLPSGRRKATIDQRHKYKVFLTNSSRGIHMNDTFEILIENSSDERAL